MIIIAVEFNFKPEARAEALPVIQRMAQASQAEAGCQTYQFYADLEDPNKFFLFERWETEEALASHGQTAHMAEFRQHLSNLLAAEIAVNRYRAELM